MYQSDKKLNESDVAPARLKAQYIIRQAQVQLAADCPVRAQRLTVAGRVRPHDHDYYEIVLVHAGRAVHRTTADEGTVIGPGTAIVVPTGAVHTFESPRVLEVTNVYYLSEWLLGDLRSLWDQDGLVPLFLARSLFRRPGPWRVPQFELTAEELSTAARELTEIETEASRALPSLVYLKSAFLKVLVILSRAFVREAGAAVAGFSFRPEVWAAMDAVERAIADGQLFSVEAVAKSAGLSPDHLTRAFRAAIGLAPREYFQERRVQQASLMLLNPRQSVTDVAMALGYADSAHLSRIFHRLRGMSPRQYRATYFPGIAATDAARG